MKSTYNTPKEHLDNEDFDSPSQQANVGKKKNLMAGKMQGGIKKASQKMMKFAHDMAPNVQTKNYKSFLKKYHE